MFPWLQPSSLTLCHENYRRLFSCLHISLIITKPFLYVFKSGFKVLKCFWLTTKICPISAPAGLKKVTDDMKTHKNPALRGSSVVKASVKSSSTTTTPKYGAAVAAKKPPKLELQNKKWIVVRKSSNLLHILCIPLGNSTVNFVCILVLSLCTFSCTLL